MTKLGLSATRFSIGLYFWFSYFLKKILILGEMLVFMRMILKFLEANSESFIVFHLYGFTDLVVWPFKAIFPDSFLWGRPLDVVAISAMIGYFILYLLIIKVLTLLIKE